MQVTDTVRVIRTAGLIRTALFATVLSVQQPHQDDDGTNGEPTVTIAYLDPEKVSLLGGPKWYEAFKRVPTVRHVSHADVQTGAAEYCYTEVLESNGGPVHLQGLNMDTEDGAPAEAAEAPNTIGTIVYINHNNDMGVLHRDENSFVAVRASGVPAHEPFSDLFSATVYVNAQPVDPLESEAGKLASEAGFPMPTVAAAIARISGSPMHLVAAQVEQDRLAKEKEDAGKQMPWSQLTEEERDAVTFPTWDGIVTRSGKTEADLEAEQAVQQQESAEAEQQNQTQDNTNEANQTPAEAVAAEQQQSNEATEQQ